jgi:phospholipid-translocating ATPase
MTFWKEMFFYTPQLLYQLYDGYTGTSLYENWSLTALNPLFTSLCVVIMGIYEQDKSPQVLLERPELYGYGQKNTGLNFKKALVWMISAFTEGTIAWLICWAAYGIFHQTGDNGLFAF